MVCNTSRPSVMSLPQIAYKLQYLMRQNRSDSASLNLPVVAIARYLGLERTTIYAAANGESVSRLVQMQLSRFLRRAERGELEARRRPTGEYEIVEVENPKPPPLTLRVELNLGGIGPRLDRRVPQQTPATMLDFKKLFGILPR